MNHIHESESETQGLHCCMKNVLLTNRLQEEQMMALGLVILNEFWIKVLWKLCMTEVNRVKLRWRSRFIWRNMVDSNLKENNGKRWNVQGFFVIIIYIWKMQMYVCTRFKHYD